MVCAHSKAPVNVLLVFLRLASSFAVARSFVAKATAEELASSQRAFAAMDVGSGSASSSDLPMPIEDAPAEAKASGPFASSASDIILDSEGWALLPDISSLFEETPVAPVADLVSRSQALYALIADDLDDLLSTPPLAAKHQAISRNAKANKARSA